jgi:hypothetical protein
MYVNQGTLRTQLDEVDRKLARLSERESMQVGLADCRLEVMGLLCTCWRKALQEALS